MLNLGSIFTRPISNLLKLAAIKLVYPQTSLKYLCAFEEVHDFMATTISSNNLCIAWTGDFESLKQFVSEHLKLEGTWSHPGGDKKLFTSEDATISWRKSKNLLSVVGEKATDIVKELCKLICKDPVGTESLGLLSGEPADIYGDIEELKSGQITNSEAIRAMSDSVLHISSVLSQFQLFINERNKTALDVSTLTTTTNEYAEQAYTRNAELISNPIVPEQSTKTTANNWDENLSMNSLETDESVVRTQDTAEIPAQLTYAKLVASQPALDNTGEITKKSNPSKKSNDTEQDQQQKTSESSNDIDDGFIGVERKRNKTRQLFLTGIAENVKEEQIQSYLQNRNINPTRITIFQSRRKGTISAKVNIPSAALSSVQQEYFWPKFVTCKPWRSNANGRKAERKPRTTIVGNYSTYV